MKASEVGLLTWEAAVSCGQWCQGGSVHMTPTTYPQHEDAEFVWVRADHAGAEIAALKARLARVRQRLIEVNNGVPGMDTIDAELLAIIDGAPDSAPAVHDCGKPLKLGQYGECVWCGYMPDKNYPSDQPTGCGYCDGRDFKNDGVCPLCGADKSPDQPTERVK